MSVDAYPAASALSHRSLVANTFRTRTFRLEIIVAFVLLAAGILKLQEFLLQERWRNFDTKSSLTILFISLELVFSFWLMSNKAQKLVIFLTGLLFTAFALYGLSQVLVGAPNCHCFGVFSTRPAFSLGIDLASLGLLVIRGTSFISKKWFDEFDVTLLRAVSFPVLLVGALIICLNLILDSVGVAATIRGEAIRFVGSSAELDDMPSGIDFIHQLRLVNRSTIPVNLIGGSEDCFCDSTLDLPVRIEPGAETTVQIRIAPPPKPGKYFRTLILYTDLSWQPRIRFRMEGKASAIKH